MPKFNELGERVEDHKEKPKTLTAIDILIERVEELEKRVMELEKLSKQFRR